MEEKEQESEIVLTLKNKKELDVQEALKKSQLHELFYQACENRLLGYFDSNQSYHIRDIVKKELINIEKIIEEKTNDSYFAFCVINKTKLNFMVELTPLDDGNMRATLKLVETFTFAKIYTATITTKIHSITEPNDVHFLVKIRSKFNLVKKDEDKAILENYKSPPIEVLTELLKKEAFLVDLREKHYALDNCYLTKIIKELKKTPEGLKLVKNFITTVKTNKLDELKENKLAVFRQLLNKMIEEEIEQKTLPAIQQENILKIQITFLEDLEKFVPQKEAPAKTEEPKKQEPAKEKPAEAKPKQKSSPAPKQQAPKEKPMQVAKPAEPAKKEEPKKEEPKKQETHSQFFEYENQTAKISLNSLANSMKNFTNTIHEVEENPEQSEEYDNGMNTAIKNYRFPFSVKTVIKKITPSKMVAEIILNQNQQTKQPEKEQDITS